MTFIPRTLAALGSALAVATSLTSIGTATSQRFYDDDPIRVDRDTESAMDIESLDISLFVDLAYNIVSTTEPINSVRAQNVNTIDEVPDSSWFTNRLGSRPLTAEDVAKGPDTTTDGPAPGTWTVSSSKSDGITPGFTIVDSKGQRWFLKFDPQGYRGMATGAEVAVTKLMWALGYNVPENRIAYLRRDQLVIGPTARHTPESGRTRHMQPSDLDRLLSQVDREPNGTYRVVASKALEGKPVGRIRFEGTRPDDPNDIVAHENRRELRGYGVFSAWLNHVDAKAINSLDTLVTEDGLTFVKHHLIDFGSTLGSGGVGPADRWAGTQYLVQPGLVGRQIVGFGFVKAPTQPADFYESPTAGRLPRDSRTFDPRAWKPRVPNPAFLHARGDDQFWAARKLAALDTAMIRAAVASPDFRDPEAEEFLVRTLAERRNIIVREFLTAVNPVVDPGIDADGVLSFANAAVEADVARAPKQYLAAWSTFDNVTGESRPIGISTGGTQMAAPAGLPHEEGRFVKVAISSTGSTYQSWELAVDAYFRYRSGGWRLVGFDRLPHMDRD